MAKNEDVKPVPAPEGRKIPVCFPGGSILHGARQYLPGESVEALPEDIRDQLIASGKVLWVFEQTQPEISG